MRSLSDVVAPNPAGSGPTDSTPGGRTVAVPAVRSEDSVTGLCAPGRGRRERRMSLEIADEHLEAAVRCLAAGAGSPAERLQTAREQHVQMVWMQPCLTRD